MCQTAEVRSVSSYKARLTAGSPPTEPFALVNGQERLLQDDLLRCLRDSRFDRVDLLVSFVMKSGLEQVYGGLLDAFDPDAKVRVLTTDYFTVTDADALARLLDLAELRPEAIANTASSMIRRRAFIPRRTSSRPPMAPSRRRSWAATT